MEIKEHSETKLLEASQTKLKSAEVVLKESRSFLENVNNLNMTEEEERQSSSEVASFLTPKQQRIWNHLSKNKKKRYLKKQEKKYNQFSEEQGKNLTVKDRKAQLNTKEQSNTSGKLKTETGKQALKEGAVKSAATGAGSVATSGVMIAGEAAKKTADKFKESLTKRAAEQAESFKQLQGKQEERKPQQKERKGMEGAGRFLAVMVGAFAGILLVVMLPVLVVVLGSTATDMESRKIVDVAKAELEVSEYNIGGSKYKEWYGLDGDWCAMFVAWCGNECGYIEDDIMVRSASVRESYNWYEERNLYQTKESGYVPKEGDLVFFLNGMSHMGIVISYDSSTDQLTVIEGNSGTSTATPYHTGSRVKQNVYQRTAGSISGYGTPAYPEIEEEAGENEKNLYTGGEET